MSALVPDDALVVFITGCSAGGIGEALAAQFSRRGCLVYASARSLNSLSGLGDKIRKLTIDVTNDASCEQAVKTIYDETGRIDIFVSNAGVASVGPLLDISLDTTRKVFDTNLYGTVRLVHLIGPQMAKRQKGLIVPIGSTAGEIPVPFMGMYNASKAALHSYTETLTVELRPLGVNVMLCSPGTIVSNIANNEAKYYEQNLPPGSLYQGYRREITNVLYSGQRDSPMPREKFANIVVKTALSKNPPSYMTAGGTTTLWAFLKWLPRSLAIKMIWKSLVENAPK